MKELPMPDVHDANLHNYGGHMPTLISTTHPPLRGLTEAQTHGVLTLGQ